MAGPYPVLPNGLGSPQGIWDVSTNQIHKIGTRGFMPDGRVYYYARQSSSNAIVAGNVLSAEAISADWDDEATDTHVVGDTYINVTPSGTKTYAENELAEGYIFVNSGTTGAGLTYRIKSNAATSAATEVSLYIYDPVAVAFNADTTATVGKNPWMDPIIMPTTGGGLAVGVSNIAVPAGNTTKQYFWCQTWGPAAVTAGAANAIGDALMPDTTTAGETLIATAGNQIVGIALFTGENAHHGPTFLMIAP